MKTFGDIIVFILVVITTSFSLPKRPCSCTVSTHENWDEKTTEKSINKALKKAEDKSPKNYYKIANIIFSQAYLEYIKTSKIDTIKFLNAAQNFKSSYTKTRNATYKKEAFYRIGLCYYYVGDYRSSEKWFIKNIKTGDPQPVCITLDYAKCLFKKNSLDSFNLILKDFCVSNKLNPDSVKSIVLSDINNGH